MKNSKNTLMSLMIFCSSFAFMPLVSPAMAQDNAAAIDEIFSWAAQDCPGCTVAVSLNGALIVNRAYGSADLERNVPLSTESIFDAGSLMKQFVAAAALKLVEDGKISLSDDIRKYIPELPDYGQVITVDHLLTHTSGIRDWTGLLMLSDDDVEALTMILRQRGLNHPPGEEWSYTSSGFVLMKEIIGRVSGMPFREFARTRMFEPLGMNSTQHCDDMRMIVKNRSIAYDKSQAGWRMAMLLDEARGGGGILTTSTDLIIWNDALTNNKLSKFVSDTLAQPAVLNNGRKLDYAHGLIIGSYRGTPEIWHTGSADGYKSYLGRFPEHGLSIAIMCNSGDGTDRREFAYRIFDLFVTDGVEASDEPREGEGPPPIPANPIAGLGAKAGLYINEATGDLLQLAVDRGRLRVAGGPGMVAISENEFRRWGASTQFMSGDAFRLKFQSDDAFDLISMEGKHTRYQRAEPWQPGEAELKALAGRYKSDEIGAEFVVKPSSVKRAAISVRHSSGQTLEFNPIHTDTFQFSRMFLHFVRNDAGEVVGIDLSNPVLRNVRFPRVEVNQE